MPILVELASLRTIPGLDRCELLRPGYVVQYDFASPIELWPSLEARNVDG
jgi:tRNA uridine 5-carboxymethylaminomethyl modification enzyme